MNGSGVFKTRKGKVMPLRLTGAIAACFIAFMSSNVIAREANVGVAPGVTLHVFDEGPIEGKLPALILVPGWRFSGAIWSQQITAFSHDRRVVAIDPRSQGRSTIILEGDTPEQRAQDLHALLTKLGVQNFVLGGWSQGVQDVAAYVARYGTSGLQGLVLVDSTISKGAANIVSAPESASRQLGLLPLFSASPREYTEGMIRAVITKPMLQNEVDGLVSTALRTPVAIGAAMLVADMFGTDRTGVLSKIDVPTLVVASPLSAELAEQKAMASGIPNAEFHVIDHAGHAVFVDQPQAFDKVLADFLEGLAGRTTERQVSAR